MSLKKLLDSIDVEPGEDISLELKRLSKLLELKLKEEIKKSKIEAEVFIGGSFAKGTLEKKDFYDIDFFLRFYWKYSDISNYTSKILSKVVKKLDLSLEKVHGSRDYFILSPKNKKIIFEIVPVTKISKPTQSRNVTDLSYFHVKYLKKKFTKSKLSREIKLAKLFCRSNNVYGAESFINGFSGYALECLIIHYKSFEKMIKSLSKFREREIIDIEKAYKKKSDVLLEMNEARLKSPIILVDPIWKERNVTAALSKETFLKFQKVAKDFLKSPSKSFFEKKEIDETAIKKLAKTKKSEFLKLSLKTKRQEGDIAGTKMKKFSKFLERESSKYFEVYKSEFDYKKNQSSAFYLILKSKKEVHKIGPPLSMKKQVKEFKKSNKKTYIKNNQIYSTIKVNFTAKKFITDWKKKNQRKIKEMSISELKLA